MATIRLEVTEQLHRAAKVYAAHQGKTLKAVIVEALERGITQAAAALPAAPARMQCEPYVTCVKGCARLPGCKYPDAH